MGAVASIFVLIGLLRAIFGLWILYKAFQASWGWFFFLLLSGLGGGVLFAETLGPVLATVIVLGGVLLFAFQHWHEVRTPFLLLFAAEIVQVVIAVQTARTLDAQSREAPTEQRR